MTNAQVRTALETANKLAKDSTFLTDLNAVATAKEVTKKAAIVLMYDLQRVLGDDGMAIVPVPGSKKASGVNVYDLYDDADEEHGETGSWFKDTARYLPDGANILDILHNISLASKVETNGEAKEPYKSMGPVELGNQKAKYKQRLDSFTNGLKESAKLYHQMVGIQTLNEVEFEIATETNKAGETVIVDTPKPIIVFDKTNPRKNFQSMSTKTFNKLDMGKAFAGGGTYKALLATVAKAPKPVVSKGKMIESVEQFHDALNAISQYLDFESEDGRKHQAAILLSLDSKKAGSDELVLAIGTANQNLDAVYGKVERRFEDIVARKAAAA